MAGKSIVTTDGKKGGNLEGKPHKNKQGKDVGGIKAVVTDANNRPVELEGGEVIINKEASKKHWKELSRINQSAGGGVPISKPIDPHDEDPEEFKKGGKIQFNPNKLPNKWILNYAKNIKKNHPEIWKKGGNIYGNQAFKNLERVAERGYWLDSEEWFYIKWRSFVARHKGDFRIAGVVAMLKWVDKVDRGWQYMKNLIQDEIKKIEARKSKKSKGGWTVPKEERMSKGGEVKQKIEKILQHIETNGNQWVGLDKYSNVRKNKYGGYNLQTSPKEGEDGNFSFGVRFKEYTDAQYDIFKRMVARKLKGETGRINHKFEDGGEVVIDESIAANPINDPKIGMAVIYKSQENELFPNVYYVLDITMKDGGIYAITYGLPNSYGSGISFSEFKNQFQAATQKQVDKSKGKLFEKGGNTWKSKYNKKYGYDKEASHDLKEISKDTGVSMKGLQEIYDKGVGARKTNPESVRSVSDGKKRGGKSLKGKMSAEQWAMARVYSSVMGGKAAKVDAKELKMEDGGEVEYTCENETCRKYYVGEYNGGYCSEECKEEQYATGGRVSPTESANSVAPNTVRMSDNDGQYYIAKITKGGYNQWKKFKGQVLTMGQAVEYKQVKGVVEGINFKEPEKYKVRLHNGNVVIVDTSKETLNVLAKGKSILKEETTPKEESYKVGSTGKYMGKKTVPIKITKITAKNVYFENLETGKEKRSQKANFEKLFVAEAISHTGIEETVSPKEKKVSLTEIVKLFSNHLINYNELANERNGLVTYNPYEVFREAFKGALIDYKTDADKFKITKNLKQEVNIDFNAKIWAFTKVIRISTNTIQKIKKAKLAEIKSEPERYDAALKLITDLTERANKGVKSYSNSLNSPNSINSKLTPNSNPNEIQKALGWVFCVSFLNNMIPLVWQELLHHYNLKERTKELSHHSKLTETTTEGKEVKPTKKTPKAKKEYADYIDAFVGNFNTSSNAIMTSRSFEQNAAMTTSIFINMADENRLLTMEDIKELENALKNLEQE